MIRLYVTSIEKLKDEECFQRNLMRVSTERRKKIETCRMEKDKARSLAAGLLLEHAWKIYLEEHGEEMVAFRENRGEYGKPFCGNRDDFCYNLSHSGEWVICGTAKEPIGVDIQQIKEVNLRIAERFFVPEEYDRLMSCEDKNQMFCQMWAMKESYIKYTGKGMIQEMNGFSVDVETGKIYDLKEKKQFNARLSGQIQDYVIAICTQTQQEIYWENYEIV